MSITESLKKIIGSAPDELVAYLEAGSFIKSDKLRINCLSFEESKEYSEAINSIPEYQVLGLWVLDDANDSNPYCYISKGSSKGTVLHLCHDDDPNIKFSSLRSFLSSISVAVKSDTDIDDIQNETCYMPTELELD